MRQEAGKVLFSLCYDCVAVPAVERRCQASLHHVAEAPFSTCPLLRTHCNPLLPAVHCLGQLPAHACILHKLTSHKGFHAAIGSGQVMSQEGGWIKGSDQLLMRWMSGNRSISR